MHFMGEWNILCTLIVLEGSYTIVGVEAALMPSL